MIAKKVGLCREAAVQTWHQKRQNAPGGEDMKKRLNHTYCQNDAQKFSKGKRIVHVPLGKCQLLRQF